MRRRENARVLLFAPDDRILLLQGRDGFVQDPARPKRPPYWFTPGGGLEEGEDVRAAAARELREETGIARFVLGPVIWTREQPLVYGGERVLSVERYVLGRALDAELSRARWTPDERASLLDMRWWTLDALERTTELVFPELLPERARVLSRWRDDLPCVPERIA